MDYSSLYKKIDRYEYISFDIFDTLLKRDVIDFREVFDLVAIKALKQYSIQSDNYKYERIAAEKKARSKRPYSEITMEDIYSNFNKFSLNELEIYKRLEYEIESEILSADKKNYDLYNLCLKNKKKIIIISDMYLSQEFLADVLYKLGYVNYYKLYVSSSVKKQKRSGELFRFVLKDLGIKSNQIIHIGDDFRSDYLMPRLNFINSIKIKSNKKIKKSNSGLNVFINNRINNELIRPYENIGYKIYGPLLFGFVNYTINISKKNKVDNIYFLSRDGYIMQKAYELIVEKNNECNKSCYLLASRRSLQVPLLAAYAGDFEKLFNFISFPPYVRLNTVFERFGYKNNQEINFKESKIDNNSYLSILQIKQLFSKDNFIKKIKNKIYMNSLDEKKCLMQYLESINFIDKNCLLVDVGWKCSSQNALFEITKQTKTKLIGSYIGVHKESKIDKNSVYGYLFDRENNMENFYTLMGAMSILELFFSAPHGAVRRYNNETVIFEEYEYNDNLDQEYNFERNFIADIQKGALKFVKDYLESPLYYYIDFTEEVAFYNLKRLMKSPKFSDIRLFGKFKFDGADGMEPIIKSKGLLYYISNPKQLIRDYSRSGWKIGYIKSIIKLPFGNFSLFRLSYSIFKRISN